MALGLSPSNFFSVDYFPLFPWLGVVLGGYGLSFFITNTLQRLDALHIFRSPHSSVLSWPGRHSLLIYLLHQPILLGVLWLVLGSPTNL
jgi:uncharacterized membrane protein